MGVGAAISDRRPISANPIDESKTEKTVPDSTLLGSPIRAPIIPWCEADSSSSVPPKGLLVTDNLAYPGRYPGVGGPDSADG